MIKPCIRGLGIVAATAVLAGPASAEKGRGGASVKLLRCGDQTCFRISGRRSDPDAPVLVEQHAVAVEGRRRWHVTLPLKVVQSWAAPFARSISVTVGGKDDRTVQAALPIGVFGHTTELAFLNVALRR